MDFASEAATNAALVRALQAAGGRGAAMRPILNASKEEAAVLAANGLRGVNNSTLRKDEWEVIDERVNEEARNRLTVIPVFQRYGLTQTIGIGDIERVTERMHAFIKADVSFDAITEPNNDRVKYESDRRAVPIVSQGFRLGMRQMASSEKRGSNLQTDSAGGAARSVVHRMQNLITNGLPSGTPSGGGLPGLTTAPLAIDVTLTAPWDGSGADIIGDVRRMLDAAYAGFFFGPFVLFVPKNYWGTLQDDYSDAKGDRTYLERIEAFRDIDAVEPLDALPDDEVLLVQMTRDVMDISMALNLTTWQWTTVPSHTDFRTLMIGGPHIKTVECQDGTARNGIVHLAA